MKHLIIVVLLSGLIFLGCQQDSTAPTEFSQNDQVSLTLEKPTTSFTGTCTLVSRGAPGDTTILPNGKIMIKGQTAEWYDDSTDPRVKGQSFWYVNWLQEPEPFTAKIWGTAEIIVDDNKGKWDLTWHGYQFPTPDGFAIECEATGVGKEGEVKGLVGKWTYTMGIPSPGFFYSIEGDIIN